MAVKMASCEECGSRRLDEVGVLEERVGYGGWDDRCTFKCRDCGHEQEGTTLRRERVPPGVLV